LVIEMGGTWSLPGLIGIEKTCDLLLTGRKISGAEAAEMGLVLVLCAVPLAELLDEAMRLATEIATGSSSPAVSVVKRMAWGRLMDGGEFYRATYEDEDEDEDDDAIAWGINGSDAAEGNAAFFEKRPSSWVPVAPDAPPLFGRRNANPFGL
jgi:enoyl-CoA hydratase/carnithine racemase